MKQYMKFDSIMLFTLVFIKRKLFTFGYQNVSLEEV